MSIRKLPEHVVRRIAAGEVVERPASVLKELLENALDAGARRIDVEIAEAGRKRVRVSDDGRGIPAKEVALALERHATSKIVKAEDLDGIRTFGFRGEALPSIAAVSRFKLVTRPAGAAEGWSVDCEGGDVTREGPCGAPPGTSVTVEDLFYCTPARSKFLKSDTTERGLLVRTVEDVALAAREVAFRVTSDGKELLSLPAAREGKGPAEALLERLKLCWGADRLAAVKPVRETGRFMTAWGWISDVHAHQGSGRYQRFFVNNRPVVSRRLTHALYEAYRGSLPVGRHPLAVLFLDVDPSLVDVNVHPSKREVRLSHEEEAYGFLYRALQSALSATAAMPTALGGSVTEPWEARKWLEGASPETIAENRTANVGSSPSFAESQTALLLQSPLRVAEASGAPAGAETDFREAQPVPLMQLDGTYILARLGAELYIFDQHAAAERVLYETFSEAAKNKAPHRQALLLPWVWETSPQTAAVVRDHIADFEKLGYELEEFGGGAFRVKGVPGVLGDTPRVRSLLEGLAEDMLSEAAARKWEEILIRAACRGSVKANDPLKPPEMEKILKDLQLCRHPWSCPHGRPTFLRVTGDELAKRFRRT
jgi:DNA mismatch repair protein MutL